MESRSVFILYQSPLFARGLGSLLSEVSGLEVMGMGRGRPEDAEVWEEIQSLAPDVIILEGNDITSLAKAADAVPGVQLVTLSLSDNRIRIYECRDAQRGGLEGILDAISRVSEGAAGPP